MENSFPPVTMEVWSCSASEEEDEKSTSSLGDEILEKDLKSHNRNNNNNNNESLCKEVTQGETEQCMQRRQEY